MEPWLCQFADSCPKTIACSAHFGFARFAQHRRPFGSTYEREVAFSERDWSHRLRPDGNPHFVCNARDGEPIGLVAVGRDEADPRVAYVLGMWVAEAARGTGAADALVAEVVRWATIEGCVVARLHVTEGNARAERMYERNDFHRTGGSLVRDRDGLTEIEMERLLSASTSRTRSG